MAQPTAVASGTKIAATWFPENQRVVANAEGESTRFSSLLKEYQQAPGVTRERLYIDAIENVYSTSNKVLLDSEGSGNLLYLPVDQLLKQNRSGSAADTRTFSAPVNPEQTTTTRSSRDDLRSRGVR